MGHNPLGMLSVLGLLLVLFAQVTSGLFADDEIAFTGPLTGLVSGHWVSLATGYHKEIGKLILVALVALHLAAIAFYKLVRKQDLVRPMITGDKTVPADLPPSSDGARQRWLALFILLLCALAVYGLVSLGNGAVPVTSYD